MKLQLHIESTENGYTVTVNDQDFYDNSKVFSFETFDKVQQLINDVYGKPDDERPLFDAMMIRHVELVQQRDNPALMIHPQLGQVQTVTGG